MILMITDDFLYLDLLLKFRGWVQFGVWALLRTDHCAPLPPVDSCHIVSHLTPSYRHCLLAVASISAWLCTLGPPRLCLRYSKRLNSLRPILGVGSAFRWDFMTYYDLV